MFFKSFFWCFLLQSCTTHTFFFRPFASDFDDTMFIMPKTTTYLVLHLTKISAMFVFVKANIERTVSKMYKCIKYKNIVNI